MLYVQIKNINSKNNIIELPVREADPEPINLEKIRKEIYKEPKDAYIEEIGTVYGENQAPEDLAVPVGESITVDLQK